MRLNLISSMPAPDSNHAGGHTHACRKLAACALFAITPLHAQTPGEDTPATLDTISVVGRAESGAYHADGAAGAKIELPLRELPQSVRVITRQAIDDLGATKLDDVLDYVGGISRQNNFGGMWDNVVIRGLPGDQNGGMTSLFNGLASGRGFNAPRDLAGVERVEFLKGPAAALYGNSEPGGTLNTVSKRPLWKPGHSAELYLGNHALKRAAIDSTTPLSQNISYRFNAAVEDRDGFRDHVGSKRRVLVPALTWRINDSTLVEYVGEWLRHQTPLDRGVVAVNEHLGVIARERFLGEPGDGDVTVDNRTHQLIISHDWNMQWKSRLGISYRETTLNGYSTEATSLQANGDLWRQRRHYDFDSDDIAVQAEVQGIFQTRSVEHELLLGIERFRFEIEKTTLRALPTADNPYSINIYNPVYGQPQPILNEGNPANIHTLERQHNLALYLQDALKLSEQWRLVAGVRVDRYRQTLHNRINDTSARQNPTSSAPRIGVSWLPGEQWTFYANAGRSFRPNYGADAAGNSFAPERGRALELGAKWESAAQDMGLTAALFDIEKRNVLTTDPVNSGFSIAAGQIRSRGLEFDFSGQLTEHWRLNASMMANEVEILRDNSLQVGGRLLGIPRINGSVLAVYENILPGGQRYGIGGGLTHTGKRLGQARTQAEVATGIAVFNLPAYTTAKLVAYMRLNHAVRLTVDVDNVFDRTYYPNSYSRLWVAPGASRTATLGLQVNF